MFVHPKIAERQTARILRAKGMPYKRIAAELGVSVNSAYRWTRDIELTPAQKQANLRGPNGPLNPDRVRRAAASWAARCRAKRAAYQADGRAAAREQRDPLHLAGCMLYWAEGTKSRNNIQFTNSDRHMLLLFRRFLTDALGVERDRICIAINVYTGNGLTIQRIERYWLDLLGLPKSSLRKHAINHLPTSSSGHAKNKLPYGVCTLRVHDTRMVQHIYGAIQEYGGFAEPRWLD
jgi:Homeodomain-like domain